MSATGIRDSGTGYRFYPEAVIEMMLAEVRKGRSLADTCDQNRAFPHYVTFYRWMTKDDELRQKYLDAVLAGEAAKRNS